MSGPEGRRQGSRDTEAPAVGGRDDGVATVGPVRPVELGRMGRFHAANLAGRVPGAGLVRAAAGEDLARHEGWLEDPEGEAVVLSSTRLHARMVEEATVAGKHGFREKPISRDIGRAHAAIGAVERSLKSRGCTVPETYTRGGAHG